MRLMSSLRKEHREVNVADYPAAASLSYLSCNRQKRVGRTFRFVRTLNSRHGVRLCVCTDRRRDVDFSAQRSHRAFLITGGMQYQIFSDGRVAWHRPAPWSDGTLTRTQTASETVNSHRWHEKTWWKYHQNTVMKRYRWVTAIGKMTWYIIEIGFHNNGGFLSPLILWFFFYYYVRFKHLHIAGLKTTG